MDGKDELIRLDDRFTHLVTTGDSVVLVGEADGIVFDNAVVADVVRRLDGRRGAIQVAEALADRHPPEIVHFALLALEDAGVVRTTTDRAADQDPEASMRGERAPRPGLATRLAEAWRARGDTKVVDLSVEADDGREVAIVLTNDYLHAELADRLSGTDPEGRPCLLGRLGRRSIWVGPLFLPGASPCLACLQERLRLNLVARSLLHLSEEETPDGVRIEAVPREVPGAAYGRMADEVRRILGDSPSSSSSATLHSVPLGGGDPEPHQVARLPHCPACGAHEASPPGAEVALRPRPREGRSGGGYRTISPDETYRRWSHLISRLTGVVRSIEKVPVEGTDLVHVYTASHAYTYRPTGIGAVRADRRDASGGKGRTDADARASALGESLERVSGIHRGREKARLARLSEIGSAALHPNDLQHFSPTQFRERNRWNAGQAGNFQRVPEPYQDEPVAWSPMRSLGSGELRWIPSAYLYLEYWGTGEEHCRGDSNGLAGGNCLEEAILQGFLELVERDAVAIWWYNRVRRPAVKLASLEDPYVDRLLEYYRGLGRSLWALDLTTDLEIPAFVALSAVEDGPREEIVFGFGAHLDARIALNRALTEVNQMIPTILRSPEERRRQLLPDFEDAIRWWETATLEEHPYLRPSPELDPRGIDDFPPPEADDLRDDVLECVARADAVGSDTLVHDLTRPDIGFPCARVVVPGLRHFWRRLGPGRLYQVPVRLGWLDSPRSEEEMNPVSVFV